MSDIKVLADKDDIVAIADEIRVLSGTSDDMSLESMNTTVADVNSEVDEQTALINRIASVLEGKSGASKIPDGAMFLETKTISVDSDVYEDSYYVCCHGDNKFIAISYDSPSLCSTDGINWSSYDTFVDGEHFNLNPSLICYGQEKFILVHYNFYEDNFRFVYSEDGVSWNSADFSYSGIPKSICYGGDKFVLAGDAGIVYSLDGVTWQSTNITGLVYAVCYGGSKFVAVGDYECYYSYDGINWNLCEKSALLYEKVCIVYGSGRFIAIDYTNDTYYSHDGVLWYRLEPGPEQFDSLLFVACCNGRFVAAGVSYSSEIGLYHSSDGAFWEEADAPAFGYSTVCSNGYISVAFSLGGQIVVSRNGMTWGAEIFQISDIDGNDITKSVLGSLGY